MMTQMKERAVELIERIPDEKMFYVDGAERIWRARTA